MDNPLSLNRYAYTNNNPLRYTDPTGHMLASPTVAGDGVSENDCCTVVLANMTQLELISAISDPNTSEENKDKASAELVRRNFMVVENGVLKVTEGAKYLINGIRLLSSVEKVVKPSVTATVDIRKFFKAGNDNGKGVIFKGLGYSTENSSDLVQLYESQAAELYAKGYFTFGELDEYGQRITIDIIVPGIGDAADKVTSLKTGWLIQTDGSIKLTTPMSGFTN
jgi:hypothetical protein